MIYRYRHPTTGQLKQVKLGLWPGVSDGDAVKLWEDAREQRSTGTDVAGEKRKARADAKAKASTVRRRERWTCGQVVDRYLTDVIEPSRQAKGANEMRRMLERAVSPVADVTAEDLIASRAHELILGIAGSGLRERVVEA